MIPRGVFDIRWSDLRFAARNCLADDDGCRQEVSAQIERMWDPAGNALACLSVRTGWDLVLRALNWPAGSEILMSAVTIRDMADIVRRHHLVPVPLDVDPETLCIDATTLSDRVTAQTRGLLVAHLFGSRTSLQQLSLVAHQQGVMVFEDCAQAYAAMCDRRDPDADVSFFSFGPIKAQTALGGGIVQFRDRDLLSKVRQCQSEYPRQSIAEFRGRLGRYTLLHGLSHRIAYTAFVSSTHGLGIDHDRLISQSVRGFGEGDLLEKIRRQPSWPLLSLLKRRLANPDREWLSRKTELAMQIRQRLPVECRLGDQATFPTVWVLPIRVSNPDSVCRRLFAAGFDATRHASNMVVIDSPPEHPDAQTTMSTKWISELVYLPLHPSLADTLVQRMTRLLQND